MSNAVGSNPLEPTGGAVSGSAGDARITDPSTGAGLFTSNALYSEVGVDPLTDDYAAEGTDTGFGSSVRRFLQSGLYNGDFSARPNDTTIPIDEEYNPLPFWKYVPATTGRITATWVAASGTVGSHLRWDGTDAESGAEAYIEQMAAVSSSTGQTYFHVPIAYWETEVDVDVPLVAFLSAQYLRVDGVTTTGTSAEVTSTMDPGAYNQALETVNGGFIPADAAWMRVKIGARASGNMVGTAPVKLHEVGILTAVPSVYIVDNTLPETYDPAELTKAGGVAVLKSTVAGGGAQLELLDTGAARVVSQAAAAIPLSIKGHASQSADLLVVENSAGTDLVAVTAAGILSIPGGGIKFPATQVASSDVNTLDDYEEGTWTPVAAFATVGTSAWTPTVQVGRYTRIGHRVWVDFTYEASLTKGTGASYLLITGLPFTVKNVTGYYPYGAAQIIGWTQAGVNNYACTGYPNTTDIYFYYTGSASVAGYFLASHFAAGPAGIYLYGSLSYEV